jgi:hypothetical protein
MGINTISIGQQLGITQRRVEYIVSQDLKPNKNGLRDFQQRALAKHFPAAETLASKLLGLVDKGADHYQQFAGTAKYEQAPTLREIVYAFEKLAEHVVYPKQEEKRTEVKRTSLNIDLKDPTALKELFAAMRGDPPATTIEAEVIKKED